MLEHILSKSRAAVRLLSGLAALYCASCANEYTESLAPDTRGVTLALKVSILERTAFGLDVPDVEKMHDLRVIITSKDDAGKECVEYNRYLDFGDGKVQDKYGYADDERLRFKLPDTNREKHIYLFANSEPIFTKAGLDLPDPEDGKYNSDTDAAPVEAADKLNRLRELTYTNDELQGWVKGDAPNGIPMSTEYDVKVDLTQKENKLELYIVRAANKITFEYINKRSRYPLFVQDWKLCNVADKAYLLPHVDINEVANKFAEGYEYGWIGWYAQHSEASEGDGETVENFHENELVFSVPEDVQYQPYNGLLSGGKTYGHLSQTTNQGIAQEPDEKVTGLMLPGFDYASSTFIISDVATYYFPETRYMPPDADEQSYKLEFTTLEHAGTPDGNSKYYITQGSYTGELTRVATLFRNTHVKIRATFNEREQTDIEVSVMNWSVVDPLTGRLEKEE